MVTLGIVGKIILFPFKLIFGIFRFLFGRIRKKETPPEVTIPPTQYPPTSTSSNYPSEVEAGNLRAKVDLMLSQVDGLKLEYEAINQRIQNIERMVKEIYVMAKS